MTPLNAKPLKPFHRKRGRPYSFKTQLAKEIFQENPHIPPTTLRKRTKKLGINITKTHARILKWRYGKTHKRKPYNPDNTKNTIKILTHQPKTSIKKLALKLKIKYNHAKQLTHRFKHKKLTKQKTQQKSYTIVNPKIKKITDLIDWYIKIKEAQKQRYSHYYKEQFYDNPLNGYNYTIRYGRNPDLTTHNIKGDVRTPIQQLRKYQIPVDLNHVHHHNKKRQHIDYHVHSHDLCRFLSNYLGLPYGSSIYFGKGHFIATDSSGLDVCHYRCFEKVLLRSLEGYEGTELLRRISFSGKLVFRNKILFEWGEKN